MTTESYVIGALIGIATFFMGFGLSQLSSTIKLGRLVDVQKTRIDGIESDFKDERKRTDERIYQVVDLVKAIIEQNGKIINQNTAFIAELKAKR